MRNYKFVVFVVIAVLLALAVSGAHAQAKPPAATPAPPAAPGAPAAPANGGSPSKLEQLREEANKKKKAAEAKPSGAKPTDAKPSNAKPASPAPKPADKKKNEKPATPLPVTNQLEVENMKKPAKKANKGKKAAKAGPKTKCPATPVHERNDCIKEERERLDDIYAHKQRDLGEKWDQWATGLVNTGNEVSEVMFKVKESCLADPAGHACADSQDKLVALFGRAYTEVNEAYKKAKVIRRDVEASRKAVINVIKNVELVKQ